MYLTKNNHNNNDNIIILLIINNTNDWLTDNKLGNKYVHIYVMFHLNASSYFTLSPSDEHAHADFWMNSTILIISLFIGHGSFNN